jgi:translocation and assembly module TamA
MNLLYLLSLAYEINFVGLKDEAALKSILDVSDLVVLQDRPPASVNGLRYRISSDIPNFLKVLRAYGYYDASVTSEVAQENGTAQVYIYFKPGTQYELAAYNVYRNNCEEPYPFQMELGQPALSTTIVNAELRLLNELANAGYPLATVEKRRVEVDMAQKEVLAAACIDEGPLCKYGPTSIFGLQTVQPRFVLRRLGWREGQTYNPLCIEETQKRLLNSDLFSSVLISHDEELDAEGELPMKMRLTEAKHRQVSAGVYYATVDGPGGIFSWTHRNLRGMGETFSFDADVSKRYIAGKITYKKPDFYRLLGAIERENVYPYLAFTYKAAGYIDKKFDNRRNFSVGFEVERINVSDSARNGTYLLAALPLFCRYNRSDDLLNPTNGYSITYQVTPFQSLLHGNQQFVKQRITTNFYIPLWTKRFVFATRLQFGSIAGTRQKNIPLPLLFIGGSEDDLRGYRYLSVSPLNHKRKPYGGRSAVFLTAETRIRITEKIGLVPFADFGTVTFSEFPTLSDKWYKSVGGGLRYFTFFGPLRFDVGFPLDKRKHVDKNYRIYASIGQTF